MVVLGAVHGDQQPHLECLEEHLDAFRWAPSGHSAVERKEFRVGLADSGDHHRNGLAGDFVEPGQRFERLIDAEVDEIAGHSGVVVQHAAIGDAVQHVVEQRTVGRLALAQCRLGDRLPGLEPQAVDAVRQIARKLRQQSDFFVGKGIGPTGADRHDAKPLIGDPERQAKRGEIGGAGLRISGQAATAYCGRGAAAFLVFLRASIGSRCSDDRLIRLDARPGRRPERSVRAIFRETDPDSGMAAVANHDVANGLQILLLGRCA